MRRFIVLAAMMAASPAIGCEMDRAMVEVRADQGERGYMTVDPVRPDLIGQRFRVTDYGERFEATYNAAAGDRRTTGVAVLRIEGPAGVIFAGTWKGIGTPFTWDDSWHGLQDLPENLSWLERAPPLTSAPLWGNSFIPAEPLALGEPVFQMMQSGPLQGLSLVFAGCEE